jgi:hypothetical protein
MESLTKEDIEKRIDLLGDEMYANEEANRMMQDEIDSLYEMLDKMAQLEAE